MNSKQVIAIGARPPGRTMEVAYTTIAGRGGHEREQRRPGTAPRVYIRNAGGIHCGTWAVIRTHPNPKALAEMLETYCQREQTYLENKALPEHVLDSFQQMWKRVEIEIQHTLQYDQPPPQAPE